jgi:hypothetical protein
MPKRLRDGNIKLAFAPTIADIQAPTVAELTAGVDLSCATLSDYTLGPSGSDTVNEKPVCSSSNVNTYGASNYEASMTFFRFLDATTFASDVDEDLPWDTFTGKGLHGYLVERAGKPSSTPWTADDPVRVFEVITDDPQDQNGVTGGFLKFVQPFSVQEGVALRGTVAGA